MADEHILTMIRAAQQAPTADDKNRILQTILDDLLSGKTPPPGDIAFPLPIYFVSKFLGRKVEGLLFADKSIEVDGKRWPSPSSNGMCEALVGYRTNMWPVWKYTIVPCLPCIWPIFPRNTMCDAGPPTSSTQAIEGTVPISPRTRS